MISNPILCAGLTGIFLALSATVWAQEAATRVGIGYVEIEGDPRHTSTMLPGRGVRKERDTPFIAAEVAVQDAAIFKRIFNLDLFLHRIRVPTADAIGPQVLRALEEDDIHFFMVDAPAEAFRPLAASVRGRNLLLFNATAPEDWLRRELCSSELVHTLPSDAIATDALVQYLVARKWQNILLLQGPRPRDSLLAAALERSSRKFGAQVIARRQFESGGDPRQRERNNPALLSSTDRDYDALFIVDDAFDFARQLPYRTVRPRPVVGAAGLEPVAWHWAWDRHGAPQLNSRFERSSGGIPMQSSDWAAWIAVKMIAQAVQRTRSRDFGPLRDFILNADGFDGYKGLKVSVRRWDHQLRQAVLLATPLAVIATAPVEGFLHQTNNLDALGDDAGDSRCRLDR